MVGVDAPRHIILYTVDSFKKLVSESELDVKEIHFDSKFTQFYNSEKYKQNIAISEDETSFKISDDEIKLMIQKTTERNKIGEGDRAIFVLTHKK